jgi:predicted nuclease of predicted toxin-antitoxin system
VKIVIDMNLGKDWVECLAASGQTAVHWSSVGKPDADDSDIMEWASSKGCAVLTADLDFGTMLAASNAEWPSVIQLRVPNTLPSYSGSLVLKVLAQSRHEIETGALVTIHADRFRIRPLPLVSAF